ncbi:hypothetical protein HXY33_09040 [Candidatus Bathyarchaeota archaeon]|nr:hypothetical protein [Candidatus Bathyarchaeota archaeon]
MIQSSDANIKIVIVSPRILANERYQREFEKVAISQRKLGFAMHGELIDGGRVIGNSSYLENEFKTAVLELMTHIQKYGKVVGKQVESKLPEPKSVDRVEEHLLSNLFIVTEIPSTILSSPTDIRRVRDVYAKLGSDIADYPFLLKNKRLYTFDNLRDPSSVFAPIIQRNYILEEQTLDWLHDDVKRNDLKYLFNIALVKYCRKRDMYYDKNHDRFVCRLKDGKDNVFQWRAGSKYIERKVARRVCGKDGLLLFVIHYAASLNFMLIDDTLFLKIEPTKTFTFDGFNPIRTEKLTSLMSRYLSKEYNNAYLSSVRFWAKYLSRLDVKISIPAGKQFIEINTVPIGSRMPVGILNEKVT